MNTLSCRTMLFIVSCLAFLSEASYARTYYFFPPEEDFNELFQAELIFPPDVSTPVIFMLTRKQKPDNLESTITFLRKNARYWIIPDQNNPINVYISGRKLTTLEFDTVPNTLIEWDGERDRQRVLLYKALQEKRDFLRYYAQQIDNEISAYMKNHYHEDYNKLLDLHTRFDKGLITIEELIASIIELALKYSIDLDMFPQVAAYYKTVIKTSPLQPHKYSQTLLMSEKEKLNSALIDMRAQFSTEEMEFLLDHVVQGHLGLSQYRHFMDLMKKYNLDISQLYPAYAGNILKLAWRAEFKTDAFQHQIESIVMSVNNYIAPKEEDDIIDRWIRFNELFMQFTNGPVTVEEYKYIGQIQPPAYTGTLPEYKKSLLKKLNDIWSDTVQKKTAETLQAFYKYVTIYQDDFAKIKESLQDNDSTVIILIGDPYDIEAYYFWFAGARNGAVIRITPTPIIKDLSNERYFELMRGKKSHFEKLLEGIGETE
ncbi:MAG: hypothetical protein AB1454_12175 [Candidatus Auribacterota bacterium]